MTNIAKLLTENMAIWTAADTEKKTGRGRASGNTGSVYGVKKLRELILKLAVHGKLVPQDPNDEPSLELLKRIQAEKAKLIAEGKLKKEKPLAPIGEDEKPFELPLGWEWVRVGSLGDWGAGATPLRSISSYYGGSMPWFKSGELVADFIDTAEESVTDLALKECSLRLNKPGDVLLAMYGATIGKASILKVAGTTNQAVCACTPNVSIFNRYLLLMLKAMKANFVGQGAGGAQPNISREKIIATLTALPPLAEQHRIVAKVDELMALCDQLEQQHSNAQEAHEILVSQLLATLTQSQNAVEFNANWQRINANFDVLFTTEASLDALKQILLQLAVMGKLVPQEPNDEPARELLKRIQAEKAKLIAEGKLKKEKPLAPISEDEKSFELPKGWEWVRFGDALINRDAERIPISSDIRLGKKGDFDYYGASGVIDKVDDYLFDKPLLLIGEDGANLINRSTPIAFIARGKYWVNNHAHVLDGINEHLLRYIELYINAINLEPYVTGTAQPKMNQAKMNSIVLALAPEDEQHRIVAKVDTLMALCDQLKTRIQQANQQQQAIADALVAQALNPATAKIIDLVKYRKSMTCYLISAQHKSPTFGRTQAEKLLAFSQNYIGVDIDLEFRRKKAGPYSGWMEIFEAEAQENDWISVRSVQLDSTKYKYEYSVKPALKEQSSYFENNCPIGQKKELDRLLKLFEKLNTQEAEIIATLFCAWNDFVIDGITATDEQIILEVRENWHPSKAKFSPEQLTKWLSWLRHNNIVPTGKGGKTIYQTQLISS